MNHSNHWNRLLLATVAGCVLTACAHKDSSASTATPAAQPSVTTASGTETTEDGAYVRAEATQVTAVVEAVDHAKRELTLLGPDSNRTTFVVDEEVKNFDQIQKGDTVNISYYESVAVQVKQPGEAALGLSEASTVERAEPGEKPAGVGAHSVTLVAKVLALDPDKGTATLEGANSEKMTVIVRDPTHYERVKVGDTVEITYTEALAISVEKASPN